MNMGLILGSLRSKKGLSQQEMAKLLEVTVRSYQLYENNARLISLEKLNIISNYFKVSLDYLLGNTQNKRSVNTKEAFNYLRLTFYLRFLRKNKKITQKELAEHLGISDHTISRYEANAKNINVIYLAKFAKYFDISIDYLGGKTIKKEIL